MLKSFWPGGVLASAYPVRSDDMKEMTTNAAKALLMDNIPEVLCNLVGAQAAKRGIIKVFDALQNPIYNKQLFYVSSKKYTNMLQQNLIVFVIYIFLFFFFRSY